MLLLKRKLQKSKKKGFPWSTNEDQYVKEISLCINLIERILKDDYGTYRIVEREWKDFMDWSKPSKPLKMDFPCIPMYKHLEHMKEQDIELLFKTLRKHLQCWWD